jgi:hypothetical protein
MGRSAVLVAKQVIRMPPGNPLQKINPPASQRDSARVGVRLPQGGLPGTDPRTGRRHGSPRRPPARAHPGASAIESGGGSGTQPVGSPAAAGRHPAPETKRTGLSGPPLV